MNTWQVVATLTGCAVRRSFHRWMTFVEMARAKRVVLRRAEQLRSRLMLRMTAAAFDGWADVMVEERELRARLRKVLVGGCGVQWTCWRVVCRGVGPLV